MQLCVQVKWNEVHSESHPISVFPDIPVEQTGLGLGGWHIGGSRDKVKPQGPGPGTLGAPGTK